MAAKSTKSKKSVPPKLAKASKPTTPKSSNSSHVPTPWLKLKQLWEAGESYEAMAKATDAHYDAEKSDPTKPTRAKIWKARNIGVNIDGKLVRFGQRGKDMEGRKMGKAIKGMKKASRKVKITKGATAKRAKAVGPKAGSSNNMEPVTDGKSE